jgi:4-amino-4-deoxy-L-arabinose transferase-like glycosyltransferase
VAACAGGLVALLLATSGGYDYHRDELYFRVLGQHPAWGYVDQPPLTPLLGRLSTLAFGDHLWALRLPSVLAVAATVVLIALIARELGGGARAQAFATLGVASAFPMIAGHLLLTASADLVVWSAVLLFAIRVLRRDEPRWWPPAGVVVGLGLYNKHLVVLLLLCLGAALLLVGPRRVLASRWLWLGVLIALVLGSPNLVYQVTHDWPQVKMAQALAGNKGDDARATLVPLQLVMLGPPLVPFLVAGLVRLWRDRSVRAVAVAYPLMCVLLFVIAGQPYYTLGLLLAVHAAGSVSAERWLAAAGPGGRTRPALVGTAFALNVVLSAVIALPLLPVAALAKTPIPEINQGTRDQIGWPAYVRQVADAYRGLPDTDRARAVVLTGNYGEHGAIARYGKAYGLPNVYSGQNELYELARPPDTATVVVVVGIDNREFLAGHFAECRTIARLDDGVGIDNEEQGRGVHVCRDPRAPWRTLWPDFQHYD